MRYIKNDKTCGYPKYNMNKSLLTILLAALLFIVTACGEDRNEDNIGSTTYKNEHSVYAQRVFEDAFSQVEPVELKASDKPKSECIGMFNIQLSQSIDIDSAGLQTDGESNDRLYAAVHPDDSEDSSESQKRKIYMIKDGTYYLLYEGELYGNQIYTALEYAAEKIIISLCFPVSESDTYCILCTEYDGIPYRLAVDSEYELADTDGDSIPEIVTNPYNEKPVTIYRLDGNNVYACAVNTVTESDKVRLYQKQHTVIFECAKQDAYPGFFSVIGNSLVEKDRELAVYEDYIIPDSSDRLLTFRDLYCLSTWELQYARNEILARHGCVFSEAADKAYFEAKRWYIKNDSFNEGMLTTEEAQNIITIMEYELSIYENMYDTSVDYTVWDMDEDGSRESISIRSFEEGEADGYSYKVCIGDTEYRVEGEANYDCFMVCNINKEEKGCELAVFEYDTDTFAYTVAFFEYSNAKISYLGRIEANTSNMTIDGSRHIVVKKSCEQAFLKNHIGLEKTVIYKVEGEKIVPEDNVLYDMTASAFIITAKTPLKIYTGKDESSEQFEISANTEVLLNFTDDTEWIGLLTEDGKQGWLKITQDGKIIPENILMTEVFRDVGY